MGQKRRQRAENISKKLRKAIDNPQNHLDDLSRMTKSLPRPQVSTPRYLVVAESMRRRIAEGVYRVGAKIPNEHALARDFGVSVMTVRQGMSLLEKQGLVARQQGRGTFVTSVFQATARIALLLGDSLTVESAHFYRAILRRLQDGSLTRQWELRHYDRLNRTMFPVAAVERNARQLLTDHHNNPFQGILELVPGDSPITPEGMDVPAAIFEPVLPHTDVTDNGYDFGVKAAGHLIRRGCRRLFFFCTHWHTHRIPESVDALFDQAREAGLMAPSVECVLLDRQGYVMEATLHQRFRALLASWKRAGKPLPDGLIFNDDVALRAVMPAILQAGIPIPRDIQIFCLGNEDTRFHYGVPVTRYEISPKAIAAHLLEALDCRMRGAEPPPPLRPQGILSEDKP